MDLKKRLKRLELALVPKKRVKFVLSEAEITDESDVVWVLFKI